MRHGRAALAAALVALACPTLLPGCASAPTMPAAGAVAPLSGRLLVKVAAQGDQPAQSHSAAFELSGDEQAGQMRLVGPLGAQVALASWGRDGATLQDGQGRRRFADLAALAEETLGEPIPLGALMHWLQGRPWPGAPHAPLADGTGFAQLGWAVDLGRWGDEAIVDARRLDPPGVSVRAKLDRNP
ncbi:MAG: lipoprotein insertase outer membrane protein LolB [Burkholderiaceae bacterium]